MATAAATHPRPHPPSAGPAFRAHPLPPPPNPPPKLSSQPSLYPAEVERDEAWVRQLQEEQNERFNTQASIIHKEHLADLENAGPFATPETLNALRADYEERLKQMRDMQQEELEQHIEQERQERLWSLGLADDQWEGWKTVIQDQAAIYANIMRTAGVDAEASKRERIRENAREAEDLSRQNEEWQSTEPQRVVDRARWAERQRASKINIDQRRQRDYAEAEIQAARARARDAHLRETLATSSDSAPSSRPDSIFSAAASSIDTPPSSVHNERWRPTPSPSPSIAIPTPNNEARRSYNGDRASPVDDVRRASPARPSPLSGTPTSHTTAHAKAEERPTVWIPPEGTRVPGRKGSTFFDDRDSTRKPSGGFDPREPVRKASGVFDRPEPVRKASGQFSSQEDSTWRAYQSPSSSQPSSQQPPNAPSIRTAPLPTSQPIYTPSPQPVPQQPQPQPYQPPPQPARQASQSRPSAPPPAAAPRASAPPPTTQPRRQDSSSAPRTVPPTQPTTSYTNTRPTPSPTTARPPPAPTTRPAPAPAPQRSAPTATYPRGPPPATDPAEDRRRQLRGEYVGSQKQREEEEERRRTEEDNERRAEEARRRGAEKRRAEEQAREAERRESERREAERRLRAGLPKVVPAKAIDMAAVWAAYESQWAAMASASQLRFRSIPWPVPTPVLEPESLLPMQIAAFVLSPAHSQAKSRKDRLREALLRWHPDRFEAKWLRKVVDEERENVKEGVGLVVRALNELLSAEGTFAA